MKKSLVFLALMAMIALGCQQRVVKQPDTQQMGQQDEDAARASEKISEETITSLEPEDISRKYIEEKEGMFEDILFDYDKYNIKQQYKPTLKAISEWMINNKGVRLSIEGHCDERGTNEYNLALGDRRAKAAKDYLISLGLSSASIDIISYGEEKPLCTDENERCWSRNRRAHFVIMNAGY